MISKLPGGGSDCVGTLAYLVVGEQDERFDDEKGQR